MIKKVLFSIFSFLLISTNCMAESAIDNPDGMYYVTEQAIFQYKVKRKEKGGIYFFYSYVVTHKSDIFQPGDLAARGWWNPSWQQYFFEQYANFQGRNSCNGWYTDHKYLSGMAIPENNIPLGGGQICSGYVMVTKYVPRERMPSSSICSQIRTEGASSGCELKCIRYETRDGDNFQFIVKNESDAFRLYEYLKNGGPAREASYRYIHPRANFSGAWKAVVDNKPVEMVVWEIPSRKNNFNGVVYLPGHDCLSVLWLKEFDKEKGVWKFHFKAKEVSQRQRNCDLNITNADRPYIKNFVEGTGIASIDVASDELTFKSDFLRISSNMLAGKIVTIDLPGGRGKKKKIKTTETLRFKREAPSTKLLELIKSSDLVVGNPALEFLQKIAK